MTKQDIDKRIMKTDLYTKFILTVIALALVAIVVRDVSFVAPISASSYSDVPGIEELQKRNKKMMVLTPVKDPDQKKTEKEEKADNRTIIDVNIVQINGKDIGYRQEDGQIPVYLTNKHVPIYFKGIPYVKVSNFYDFKEGATRPAKEPVQVIEAD